MKKITSFFLFFILLLTTQAATPLPTEPTLNAKDILLPVGKAGKWISLMELSTIGVKDFEVLQEKKLSFFQKIGFRLSQRKLRNEINEDGTMTNKMLMKYAGREAEGNSGFHAGGFFLGLLLNIYAIPIVYLMKDENRKRRIKSMWIGLGVLAILIVLFAVFVGLAGFS